MIRRERARRGYVQGVIAERRLRGCRLRPVEAEAELVRLCGLLEWAATNIAAFFSAATVAIIGSSCHARLFEVRAVVRHPRIAVWSGHRRDKIGYGTVDFLLGCGDDCLGVGEVSTGRISHQAQDRPRSVTSITKVRVGGARSRRARSGTGRENTVGVGGADGVNSVEGHIAAHATSSANRRDVAKGEEDIADAVGNVLEAADASITTDDLTGTDTAEANSAVSTGKIERVGAAQARAGTGGKVNPF